MQRRKLVAAPLQIACKFDLRTNAYKRVSFHFCKYAEEYLEGDNRGIDRPM